MDFYWFCFIEYIFVTPVFTQFYFIFHIFLEKVIKFPSEGCRKSDKSNILHNSDLLVQNVNIENFLYISI